MTHIRLPKLAIITLCLLFFAHVVNGQNKTLSGVYAGVKLMPSVMGGGGMNRIDVVILFRPDGSFNDELDKPDWQKRSTGRYSISGNSISLKFADDGHVSDYKIESGDKINAGSFRLLKQPMDNNVPKGLLKFEKMSSMGGIGTGMTYVGASSSKDLYFDGKGNFSNNNQNASVVSGSGIGGGGSSKNSGSGTYKISKGVLSLTFSDGKTRTHSFFCRPGEKPVMAVIDGDIYFMDDDEKGGTKSTASNSSTKKRNTPTAAATTTEAATNTPADNKALLLKANATHGGTKLDNVKTITFEASVQGILATGYIDVSGGRLRLEMSRGGKLLQVQQLEGDTGWEWQAGKTMPLTATRINEMRTSFYTGILGLRKAEIDALQVENVKSAAMGTAIVCTLNGKRYAYIINDKGQMAASGDLATRVPLTTVYSDFRDVGGIMMPHKEVNAVGKKQTTMQYSNFRINPDIPADVWNKPASN